MHCLTIYVWGFKIYSELSSWKDSDDRKLLMVLGCRQVGKTHSIREFLSANYESYILDFDISSLN